MFPKVLVAIPAYNKENYIANSIKSILRQTFTDYKILILDNKSTDNTKKLISKKFKRYINNKIEYKYFNQHVNIRDSFQRILKYKNLKKFKYLKILCADDCIHKDYLKLAIKSLDKSEPKFFGFGSNLVYKNKKKFLNKRNYGFYGFEKILSIFFKNFIGCHSTIMLKTSFLKNKKFTKDLVYSGDLFFYLNFYLKGKKLIFSKKYLTYFEIGEKKTETNKLFGTKIMINDRKKMRDKIISKLYKNNKKKFALFISKIIFFIEKIYFGIFNFKIFNKKNNLNSSI